jgi:hypothetical protein
LAWKSQLLFVTVAASLVCSLGAFSYVQGQPSADSGYACPRIFLPNYGYGIPSCAWYSISINGTYGHYWDPPLTVHRGETFVLIVSFVSNRTFSVPIQSATVSGPDILSNVHTSNGFDVTAPTAVMSPDPDVVVLVHVRDNVTAGQYAFVIMGGDSCPLGGDCIDTGAFAAGAMAWLNVE